MLQELTLTPATIVIALLVIVWAVWAVRRLTKRGMCDCDDHCDGCSQKDTKGNAKSSCKTCGAADAMIARMESSLHE